MENATIDPNITIT